MFEPVGVSAKTRCFSKTVEFYRQPGGIHDILENQWNSTHFYTWFNFLL